MNNKAKNLIKSGLITALIGILLFSFLFVFRNCYSPNFNAYNDKLFLFNDTVIKYIDTNTYADVRDYDKIYWYNLYNTSKEKYIYDYKYRVVIWEFNKLDSVKLDNVKITTNYDLSNIKINRGIGLSPDFIPHIKVKLNMSINNQLNLNLSDASEITKLIDSKNYMGVLGKIDKFSLSNNKDDHVAVIDNDSKKIQSLILVYKYNFGFYLIYIFSDNIFDESVINLLNLK